MNFYYVYVLRSTNKDFMYVGITSDLVKRLGEHNSNKVKSTKADSPYELIFYEAYRDKSDAYRREKYLKTTKGKTTLKTMLKSFLG